MCLCTAPTLTQLRLLRQDQSYFASKEVKNTKRFDFIFKNLRKNYTQLILLKTTFVSKDNF